MKKSLLALFFIVIGFTSFSQGECFVKLQKAFDARGANAIANDMHRNVIISYFQEGGSSYCISGKVRVDNGLIVSIFLQFDDNTYELMDKKFYNSNKQGPTIINGISEMIYNSDGEKFKVVFIDALKPKKKAYKSASLPDDL